MSDTIEQGDNNNEGLVRIGQEQPPVSLKVYQAIYHQITGKTQQIRQSYSDNLLVGFSDLEELHHKVMQLCDVHHVVASNATFSVFHDKERKGVYTSFDSFRTYSASTTSPTTTIVFKYHFSITPAGLKQPQEYVVTIRLISRLATIRQMEEEAPPFMRGRLFGYLTRNVAEVTVDHADYVIARGFIEALGEWVKGCRATPKSALLHILRQHSHRIPVFAQLCVAMVMLVFAIQALPEIFSANSTPATHARFFIILLGGAYIVLTLVRLLAQLIEQTIDSYPVLSYLQLNKGDEKLIAEAVSEKSRAWLRLVLFPLAEVALGIVAAKLEKFV
jgi:hypothetical protein